MDINTAKDPVLLGDKPLSPRSQRLVAMLRDETIHLRTQLAPQHIHVLLTNSFQTIRARIEAIQSLPGLYPHADDIAATVREHRENGIILQTVGFGEDMEQSPLVCVYRPRTISFAGPDVTLVPKQLLHLNADSENSADSAPTTNTVLPIDLGHSFGHLNTARSALVLFNLSLAAHWPEHNWQSPKAQPLPAHLALAAYTAARMALRTGANPDPTARKKLWAGYEKTVHGLLTDHITLIDDDAAPGTDFGQQLQTYVALADVMGRYRGDAYLKLDQARQFCSDDPDPSSSLARFFASDLKNFVSTMSLSKIQIWALKFYDYYQDQSDDGRDVVDFGENPHPDLQQLTVQTPIIAHLHNFIAAHRADTPEQIQRAVQRVIHAAKPQDFNPRAEGESILRVIAETGVENYLQLFRNSR